MFLEDLAELETNDDNLFSLDLVNLNKLWLEFATCSRILNKKDFDWSLEECGCCCWKSITDCDRMLGG